MLAADMMRCWRSECPHSSECARYLLRKTNTHERTPMFWGCPTDEYEFFIQATEQEKQVVRENQIEAVKYFVDRNVTNVRDIQSGLWRVFGLQIADSTVYYLKWRLRNPASTDTLRRARKLVETIGKQNACKYLRQLADNPIGGAASRKAQESLEFARKM